MLYLISMRNSLALEISCLFVRLFYLKKVLKISDKNIFEENNNNFCKDDSASIYKQPVLVHASI